MIGILMKHHKLANVKNSLFKNAIIAENADKAIISMAVLLNFVENKPGMNQIIK
jgi:hypothetical protein